MAFIKVYKTKAYYKRFQTRFRRRREGKTDYYARKRLITQDKSKYNTAKYRLVARLTCSRVIAQVVYSTIQGDRIVAGADSYELKRYGLETGLTNYAACYATGLLVARRLLSKTGLDKLYSGAKKVDGEDYDVSNDHKGNERRPFKAVLDVGLTRTTTGNRVFGILKGACDGGLHVPHSTKRFPGFTKETGKGGKETYNAKAHRERIFGLHVEKYMKTLKDSDKEAYTKQFSKWDAALKKSNVTSLEKLYTKVHEEIRKNPAAPAKTEKKKVEVKYTDKRRTIIQTTKGKYTRERRFTLEERKKRVQQKIAKALQ
jgi:large subunit ribosomal protein L5e